jgi:hypothetical protein
MALHFSQRWLRARGGGRSLATLMIVPENAVSPTQSEIQVLLEDSGIGSPITACPS